MLAGRNYYEPGLVGMVFIILVPIVKTPLDLITVKMIYTFCGCASQLLYVCNTVDFTYQCYLFTSYSLLSYSSSSSLVRGVRLFFLDRLLPFLLCRFPAHAISSGSSRWSAIIYFAVVSNFAYSVTIHSGHVLVPFPSSPSRPVYIIFNST